MGLTLNNSFFYESDILLHFCRGGGGGGGEGHLRRLKGGVGVNGFKTKSDKGGGGVKKCLKCFLDVINV